MKSEMRHVLARESFEEKIRKVGQLIRLAAKLKTERCATNSEDGEAALLISLDKATAELDAGKGIPIDRAREDIHRWAKSPRTSLSRRSRTKEDNEG